MADALTYGVKAGSTSVRLLPVLFQAADNTPETGLVAADITAGYFRDDDLAVHSITVTDLANVNSAYSSGGLKEIDDTARPGQYRFDVPNVAFASGANVVSVYIKTDNSYWEVTLPIATISPADVETDVLLIKTKTNNLPGSPAAAGDPMTLTTGERTSIADRILTRDWSSVTGEAARSMLNALRFLRNKWSVSGSTLTVTKEDDSTSAWDATLTSSSSADPITGSDPS